MQTSTAAAARLVGGELHGDGTVLIQNAASLEHAGPHDLAFVEEKHLDKARTTLAGALIVPRLLPELDRPQIVAPHPYLAFTRFLQELDAERRDVPEGIHPAAVVDDTARLGEGAALGPGAVVGARTLIGARTRICAHAVIGADCRIGDDGLIYPNVTVREGTVIGDRVILHCGTSIGGDGFGYIQHQGRHVKVPQIGTVTIGDDVEIGCNCTVDRATMDRTVIGNDVKIDNHCHIAHNCLIGDGALLVAYARIGGGTVIGRGVVLAEDVGVTDHVTIGDGAIVAGSAKVSKDVAPGTIVWGMPAQDIRKEKRQFAAIRKLPEFFERLKALEQRLGDKS